MYTIVLKMKNKEDVDFLERLSVQSYKIASGQLTELPFLEYVASKMKSIILSTGMSTMSDVFNAVNSIRNVGNNIAVTNFSDVITNLDAYLNEIITNFIPRLRRSFISCLFFN